MARTYESIPGPKEMPFIGSALRRLSGPLQFFREMQETCGDAARFTLFREKFILFSDPALVDEVLITKNKSFRKGRALEGARVFLGNSLLVSEGEEHTRQRRLIAPAFHKARIEGYATIMADRAWAWSEAQAAGAEIDLAVEMNRLTLAVVAATLFGSDVDHEAGDIAQSLTVIIESFNRMLLPLWRRKTCACGRPSGSSTRRSTGSSRSGARTGATTAICFRCCWPPRMRRTQKSA
jgi:cytochrome P450